VGPRIGYAFILGHYSTDAGGALNLRIGKNVAFIPAAVENLESLPLITLEFF
jgi:hypothetical protein